MFGDQTKLLRQAHIFNTFNWNEKIKHLSERFKAPKAFWKIDVNELPKLYQANIP